MPDAADIAREIILQLAVIVFLADAVLLAAFGLGWGVWSFLRRKQQ